MEQDKIYDELKTIRTSVGSMEIILAGAMEGIRAERDRVTRELELAAIVHAGHDRDIGALSKILKGNGEKGLLERHRDLEEQVLDLRKQLVDSKTDSRNLIRSIVISTIALVITLTITTIARGG